MNHVGSPTFSVHHSLLIDLGRCDWTAADFRLLLQAYVRHGMVVICIGSVHLIDPSETVSYTDNNYGVINIVTMLNF
jgi:hypothetical protein